MKRILKVYAVITTICFCITFLLVGVIIANNNSRRLSFGEQYEAIQIYNTNSNKIGISANDRYFEVSQKNIESGKDVLKYVRPVLSPFINNFIWVIENIQNISS